MFCFVMTINKDTKWFYTDNNVTYMKKVQYYHFFKYCLVEDYFTGGQKPWKENLIMINYIHIIIW